MKKLFLTTLTLAGALSLSAQLRVNSSEAQIAEISSPTRLLSGVQSDMHNPVLSTDGTKLLFSSSDYSNLRVYDFIDNVTKAMTATKRQSFKSHFIGADNAVSFNDDTQKVMARTAGSQLFITVNGKETAYQPVECNAGYCWASVSPNADRVMFVAAGQGVIITDLKGNIIGRPGNYEAPVWYNNDYIVAQNSTDDGHQYSSSQIVMLSVDGTKAQALTNPESMTMSPTASSKAGMIVYSTIDGMLYRINVKLK
jgi:hypothetical protein